MSFNEIEIKEKIFNQTYKSTKIIFNFNNTTIYVGTNLKNNEKVIIKEIKNNKIDEESWIAETDFMKKFKSKNSVQFLDKFKINDNFYIVMEYCDYNLKEFLDILSKKNKKENNLVISIKDIKDIMNQFNNILSKIINTQGVHRDIKPENIFVKIEKNDEYTIKLGDYGFSKILASKDYFTSKMGTKYYEAPEIKFNNYGEKLTNKTDLWSIGILIYYLCFKNFPINEDYIFVNKKSTKNKDLDDLISKLLVKDPKERLNWEDYFKHPFFHKNDNNVSSKTENNFILMNGKYKIIKKYKKYDVYSFYENLLNYW